MRIQEAIFSCLRNNKISRSEEFYFGDSSCHVTCKKNIFASYPQNLVIPSLAIFLPPHLQKCFVTPTPHPPSFLNFPSLVFNPTSLSLALGFEHAKIMKKTRTIPNIISENSALHQYMVNFQVFINSTVCFCHDADRSLRRKEQDEYYPSVSRDQSPGTSSMLLLLLSSGYSGFCVSEHTDKNNMDSQLHWANCIIFLQGFE